MYSNQLANALMQSSNSRKLKLLASLNHLVKKSLHSSLFLLFLINKNSSFSSHALYNSSLSASILSKAGHSSVFKLLDVLDSNILLPFNSFLSCVFELFVYVLLPFSLLGLSACSNGIYLLQF